MNIGQGIKRLRKERKLGQKDLSKMAGISVNALSQIETYATFPKKSTIKNLCKSMNIPVAYLFLFCISDELPKIEGIRAIYETTKAILLGTNYGKEFE